MHAIENKAYKIFNTMSCRADIDCSLLHVVNIIYMCSFVQSLPAIVFDLILSRLHRHVHYIYSTHNILPNPLIEA